MTKIFHFGRFDIAMFWLHLGVVTAPVYCTKIASKLARTYTDRHGLKDVTKELIGIDLSKAQQSSDWGAAKLSDDQVAYAASDVLHLHALRTRLDEMLVARGPRRPGPGLFRLPAAPRPAGRGRLGRRRHLRPRLTAAWPSVSDISTVADDRAGGVHPALAAALAADPRAAHAAAGADRR